MDSVLSWLEGFLPAWQGFVPPTSTTGYVLVVVSMIGAVLVEYTANLSTAAQSEAPRPDAYSTQMFCLDSMGELLYGVFSIVQLSLQYSSATAQLFWLALLPTYLFQAAYGLWQAFNYCALQRDWIYVKRSDGYGALFDNFTMDGLLNFLLSQATPSRFNLIPDIVGMLAAGYFNNWMMAAWFGVGAPLNVAYELYYLVFPEADMPPWLELGGGGQYDVVNA